MALDRRWIGVFVFVASAISAPGCQEMGSQMAREENRKMDALMRCGEELQERSGHAAYLARSQGPEELPPVRIGKPATVATDPVDIRAPGIVAPPVTPQPATPLQTPTRAPEVIIRPTGGMGPDVVIKPVSNTAPARPTAPRVEGDTQVRIVASIGNTPIYESEVREAVYQRLGEFVRLSDSDRVTKEKAIFREELRRLIERELILDEMTAVLTQRKQTAGLTQLKEAAVKEADQRLKEFKKERGVTSDAEFKDMLRSQGLTVSGIRRQIERGFMMQAYLREKFKNEMDVIGLNVIREYYDTHGDEFKADDNVKWQDLFVLAEKFPSAEAAKLYAETMVNRAKKEDFSKLAKEFSQGDSASRDGAGVGEKPGEIFPPELEPTILQMKKGQIAVVPTPAGYHIIRIAERTYAGKRPFDEKLQADIKRRVQNQLYDRNVKRLVDTLWKRIQPQIWME